METLDQGQVAASVSLVEHDGAESRPSDTEPRHIEGQVEDRSVGSSRIAIRANANQSPPPHAELTEILDHIDDDNLTGVELDRELGSRR